MNLHGLISRPPSSAPGSEHKPPTPAQAAPTRNFGDIVTGNLPQPVRQDGEPPTGPGVSLPPGLGPVQFPAAIHNQSEQLIVDPAQDLNAEAQTTIAGEETTDSAPQPVPNLEHPHVALVQTPVAPDRLASSRFDLIFALQVQMEASVSDDVDVPARPNAEPRAAAVIAANLANNGPPTSHPATPAPATGGVAFGIVPNPQGPAPSRPLFGSDSPGESPDVTKPSPRDVANINGIKPGTAAAGTATANLALSAIPNAPLGAPAPTPTPVQASTRELKPLATASTLHIRTGKSDLEGRIERPDVKPNTGERGQQIKLGLSDLKPKFGDRDVRRALDAARSVQAKLPGEAKPEPSATPAPDIPELPAMARGRATLVHDAALQARTDLSQIGLAVSAAASSQSTTAPAQSLAPALQANAGGAEIARMVAPQIATAIGSGPSSGRIELRLDPPELGKVEILLEISDLSLRATVIAERPMVNEMLRRHGDVLLTQLQQAGFTGVDLQFGGNRAGNQPGAHPDDTLRPAFAGDHDAHTNDAHADASTSHQARRTSDGLDLRL